MKGFEQSTVHSPVFKPFPFSLQCMLQSFAARKNIFCPPSFLPILLHLLPILFFPDAMLPLPLYLYSNVQSLMSTKWSKQALHPDILVKCHVRIVLPRCDEGVRGQSVHLHVVYTPAPLSGHLLTPVIHFYVYCHRHHAHRSPPRHFHTVAASRK